MTTWLYSGDNVNLYFDITYINYLAFITLKTRLHLRFMYYSVNYTELRSSPLKNRSSLTKSDVYPLIVSEGMKSFSAVV